MLTAWSGCGFVFINTFFVLIWGPAGGDEDFNRTHVTLERDAENIEDAILTIEHVELTDRNTYKCIASNEATDFNDNYKPAEDEAYVRVKGRDRTVVVAPKISNDWL